MTTEPKPTTEPNHVANILNRVANTLIGLLIASAASYLTHLYSVMEAEKVLQRELRVPLRFWTVNEMMLLIFRFRSVAISVLAPIALVVFQMVTPNAYAQEQNLDCNRNTACSEDGRQEINDVKDMSCVLVTVEAKLDDLETRVADRRKPLAINMEDLRNVQKELKRLALGQRRPRGRFIANLDNFLVQAHVKYKALKKCKEEMKNCNVRKYPQYSRHLDNIDKSIHALLTRRGLHRTMSAVARSGTTLVDVANDGKIGFGESSAPLPQSFSVLLSTKHWRDEEGKVDLSLTGQIGTIPILAIYRSDNGRGNADSEMSDDTSTSTAMSNGMLALHQSGLIYESQFNVNFHVPGNAEVSLFWGIGQTRLWSRAANIDLPQQVSPVQLAMNGPGLSAYRHGLGLEYKLYDQEMDIIHHNKSLLSPVFSFGGGWRWDERLRALSGRSMSEGGTPCRFYWRLGFDLRQIIWQRKVKDKGKINSYGIRLVADRESGGTVPTANRLVLELDVDLGKLLMGNATSD